MKNTFEATFEQNFMKIVLFDFEKCVILCLKKNVYDNFPKS